MQNEGLTRNEFRAPNFITSVACYVARPTSTYTRSSISGDDMRLSMLFHGRYYQKGHIEPRHQGKKVVGTTG